MGKGTHAALDRFTHLARRFRYALPCDVREFFPSIDHAILRDQLARVIRDGETLWLCDRILESGAGVLAGEYTPAFFPGDDLLAACPSATSPASFGPMFTSTRSTSSSSGACAAGAICAMWTIMRGAGIMPGVISERWPLRLQQARFP